MDVDPLASMRCWEIELELGGRTYDVPALSAIDWWPVLISGDPTQLLDFVVSTPEDPFNLDDLLLEGAIDPEELAEVTSDAIEAAAGRTFYSAYVLATVAASQWSSVNGALVRHGFRWEDQPLGAALDAIYAEVTSRLEKDNLTKFLTLLDNPPVGKKARPRDREKVMDDFETIAGPRPTSGVRSTGEPSEGSRPKTRTQPRPPRQDARSTEPKRPRAPRAGSGRQASS
jgi:hypothetical protein